MKAHVLPRFAASELALVVSLFTGLTLAWTWPLADTIGRVLPSDLGDPLLNTWILGWAADRAAHGFRGLWNAPIFFPYPNTLAYSEHLLGILPVTFPVQWLTRNPVAGYDVAFVFSYVLAGTGMYVLARSVCGRRDAALLAALTFAFSPYRQLQLAHLQVLMSGWMPLALFALHRYLATRSVRMLALLVVTFLLQALSNGYLLYYLPVALVIVALREFPWRDRARWRTMTGLAVAAALVLAALAPVGRVYFEVRREQGFQRSAGEMAQYGATLGSYLHASNRLRLWGPLLGGHADTEDTLFPGAAALVLAGLALVARPPRRTRHTVTYALVAATAAVLSFGPHVFVGNHLLTEHGPYAWLVAIVPGLNGLRVPARLGLVVILALSVLAAIGAGRVLRRLPAWPRRVVTGLVGAVILAEGFGQIELRAFNQYGRAPYRVAYDWLKRQPPGALLTLPVGEEGADEVTMSHQYGTLVHGHPLVHGFSGYQSPLDGVIAGPAAQPFLTLDDLPGTLDALREIGVRYILMNEADYVDAALATATLDALTAVGDRFLLQERLGSVWMFVLRPPPPSPAVPDVALLARVPPNSFRAAASHNQADLRLAFDGRDASRWQSGHPQSGDEWISLTFDRPRDIALVRLVQSPRSFADYPRELVVESSGDGVVFSELFRGSILKDLWRGLLRTPAYPPADVPLPSNGTRVLRLRQSGRADSNYWSVQELTAFER